MEATGDWPSLREIALYKIRCASHKKYVILFDTSFRLKADPEFVSKGVRGNAGGGVYSLSLEQIFFL